MDDFLQFMKEKDGIKFYNFIDVLINRPALDSNRNSYLDIALIDNFDDVIDLSKIELTKS